MQSKVDGSSEKLLVIHSRKVIRVSFYTYSSKNKLINACIYGVGIKAPFCPAGLMESDKPNLKKGNSVVDTTKVAYCYLVLESLIFPT